jgi:hypothetical protein
MKLKPLGNFTGNGTLKGTIVAYDDASEPLGWEMQGNWSLLKFRESAAKSLSENTGISPEKATAMLVQLLRLARKEVDLAPPEYNSQERVMKAILPELVDIVAEGDGSPAFLFVENGVLLSCLEPKIEGKLYIPPAPEHMPYLLPRFRDVNYAYRNDDATTLFSDLVGWHKNASKLAGDGHYHLVALFDFHTYLSDQADYSPYLVFQTIDSERGKSRQGNSIAWVAYRGIVTETLQEANLFRWADSLAGTLFFDVRDIITKTEKRGSDDILLGRYQRHGAKVARVLDPQAGPFKGVTYFNVYGPTIMALNEPLHEPYLSRSIVIVPPEASGKYPNITPLQALPLKERLVAFRAHYLGKPLPQVGKPVDGRLGDSLQPFWQIAKLIGGEISNEFPDLANTLASERASERAESKDAKLILVLEDAFEEGDSEKVSVKRITEIYNEGIPEKSQMSEEKIGRRLTGLGFKPARLTGGERARLFNPDLVEALKRKFGLDIPDKEALQNPVQIFSEKEDSPVPSLLSLPSLSASAHDSDGLVTDQPSVMTDRAIRHSTVTHQIPQNQLQNDAPVTEVTVVTDPLTPCKEKISHPSINGSNDRCWACGGTEFWQRPDGGWVCSICHPKPEEINAE